MERHTVSWNAPRTWYFKLAAHTWLWMLGRLLWLESVMSDLDSWWCVCCGKLTQHLTVAWVSSVDVKYT